VQRWLTNESRAQVAVGKGPQPPPDIPRRLEIAKKFGLEIRPPASLAFLMRNVAPLRARVLFPCCSTGYEAHAFYEVGQRVPRNPWLSLFSRRIGHTL
jgi:hypothetical protein